MAAHPTEFTRPEQRSVIEFLVAEKCKPCEIYRRVYDVHEKAYLNRNVYIWTKNGFATTSLIERAVHIVKIH